MSSARRMVYQLRNNGVVLTQVDSKAAVKRQKKAYEKSGVTTQIYTIFIKDDRKPRKRRIPRPRIVHGPRWTDEVPITVSYEAVNGLPNNWETISEPFMLGSYRGKELCTPANRDGDLSIQPKGDGLALCYQSLVDGRVYLVLDMLDVITVVGRRLSIGGIDRSGHSVMLDFTIDDPPYVKEFERVRTGWYYVGGPVVFIDEPIVADADSRRYGILGDVPYVVAYPDTLGRRRFSVAKGLFEVRDTSSIEDRLDIMFGRGEREPMHVSDPKGMADAFVRRDTEYLSSIQRHVPHLAGFDFTVRSYSRSFFRNKKRKTLSNKKE